MFSTQILLPILMTLCTFYFTASALKNTILFSCDGKVLRGGDGGQIVHTSTRKFKIRIRKPPQQKVTQAKQKEKGTEKKKEPKVFYEEEVTRLYWTREFLGDNYIQKTFDGTTASIGIIIYTKRDNKPTIFDNKRGNLEIEINLAAEELKGFPQEDMSGFKKLAFGTKDIFNKDSEAWVKLTCALHTNTLLDIKKNGEYKTASCTIVSMSQGWSFILV